ncbi:hypothetical protein Syun_006705 [Stephania yunnanensis]|uniref:Uncharacterized protein n=1 Tax=Stephania yunnanensis TaxID=152371 RepID=A0AAP0L0I2_9MAGN
MTTRTGARAQRSSDALGDPQFLADDLSGILDDIASMVVRNVMKFNYTCS